MLQRWLAILILAAGMLAACAGNAPAPTATPAPASPTAHNAPTPATAPTNTPAPTPTLTPSPTPNPSNKIEMQVYREFEPKEFNPEYQHQVAVDLAGGVFINTDKEWQELNEQMALYEDIKTHVPTLVSGRVAKTLEQEYGQDISISPWAKLLAENWGSPVDGKLNFSSKLPPVAIYYQDKPAIFVSLSELNPLLGQKDANGVVLTADGMFVLKKPVKDENRVMNTRWNASTERIELIDEYHTATHYWDEDKKEWVELEEYQAFGDPRERTAQALKYKAFEEQRVVYDTKTDMYSYPRNVLGLDKAEVELAERMLKEGKPIEKINEQVKSFYILTDAQGEPRMVAVVGGEYGLTPEQLTNLKKAVAGIEAVDPGRLAFLADQFGARFISRRTKFISEADGGTFSSNNYRDTIVAKSKSVTTVPDSVLVLLAESGEIHVGRHMTSEGSFAGKMSEYNNVGVFASQWTIDWLKLHGNGLVQAGIITQKELSDITNLAKYNLEQYSKE